MPSVTIGVTERVTVVVVVTKTLVSTPPTLVSEKPPYSSEVTYLLGMIVVGEPNDDVGMISRQDLTVQVTVGNAHTSVPTHTMSTWSLPGSGTHTLTSVEKPR